jgi:hypothetical protein
MKPQDVGFILLLIVLSIWHRSKIFFFVGLLCFLIAIPLFQYRIFFTAERLTWYGAAYILLATILLAVDTMKKRKS